MATTKIDSGWVKAFEDEFDNLSLWNGSGGTWKTSYQWGNDIRINGELQYYVDPRIDKVNPFVIDDGVLSIRAEVAPASLKNDIGGREYTSGLLTTEESFSQTYGYFEVRAKVPEGKGLWPAFWMLPSPEYIPNNVSNSAEIDILEVLGDDTSTLYTSVHTNETGQLTSTTFDHATADLSRDFHTFGLKWTPSELVWFLDGTEIVSRPTPADLHSPMYLQLNLAVGGNWPGAPNNSTVFPADYMIDYVRVYGPRESSFVLQTIESLEVEEHAPVGTKVGVVMALTSDGQPADVTYSLLNDPLGRFAIDPKNGTISVANSNLIDFELDAAPTFTVLAAAPDGSRATLNTAASLIDIADSDASSVSAIKFDGHGDVSVPHHKALDPTGDFTIEVRARFDSFSGHQILVQKSTDWEKNGFFLKLTNGTLEFLHGSPKGALPTPNGSIDLLQEDNHGIALNAWHDIALVRKGANEYFYVDGNLIASAASKSSLVSSNGEFIIGEGVIGSIDEVRLWDHSRQPDDIKSDLGADLTGNEHGLVAHYTFQDSGTAVVDRTGNGHDGVVTKATWVDGSGKGDTSKINEIDGTDKSETLNGTNEDDSIHGKGGRDTINGRDGEDEIHGDAGNDRLNGQDGNDVLLGGPGNDRLQGGAGADSLNGGPGRDVLIGGDGEDTFIFDDGNRADTVRDFKPGLDKIWLKISAFADNNIGDFSEYLRTKVTNGDLLIQFDGNGELKGGTQTLAILKDGKDLNLEQLIADGDLWVT